MGHFDFIPELYGQEIERELGKPEKKEARCQKCGANGFDGYKCEYCGQKVEVK